MTVEYVDFLNRKAIRNISSGFEPEEMNPAVFQWQQDITGWAIKKGRAGLFEDCGLGKTIQQLEWAKQVLEHTGKPVLILAPLAVSHQTKREGSRFGYEVNICRSQEDIQHGINITNYEMLEHFDAGSFSGIVLDESSILKHHNSKTRGLITDAFRDTLYKLSCTATPAPNDYMELGNQAEFLGIMSRTEMLSEFFVHDGGDTAKWRLKGHAEQKFWEWLATWAVVLTKPSDLGYEDDGYALPPLNLIDCVVKSEPGEDDGQLLLTCEIAQTLMERRRARRDSLEERCKTAAELVKGDPESQWLIWCDLNSESEMLVKLIPDSVEVRGSDNAEHKEKTFEGFSNGDIKHVVTKPSIAGFGLNWQSCHNMIFVGLSDSYEMVYQAIRRCYRFGQKHPVNVYFVTSEAEGAVKANIERKEQQAARMISEMVKWTRNILESEIRGTVRERIDYNPGVEMILPAWIA